MSSTYTVDASGIDEIQNLIKDYPDTAEKTINDILHGEGEGEIEKRILPLIHPGHEWGGKKKAPHFSGQFSHDEGLLSVTVAARGKWGYLYFPDDGTNTQKHAGNQQFMQRGAENAAPKIIELCIGRLQIV